MISIAQNNRDLSLCEFFKQQKCMLHLHSMLLCHQHISGSQYQISLQTVYSPQKLFLSQSGISTAVRELENELGIRVLARSNRGVEFTPEGKEFLSYAVSLLEQKRGIESLYGEARNAAAPVRFSVSCQRYPFAVDAFLRLLRIAGENRFRFGLRETGMDGVIDDVYDHRADVGVICLTDLTEKIICRLLDARELEFHELAAVCPCIYVRGGHPLAGRSSVCLLYTSDAADE